MPSNRHRATTSSRALRGHRPEPELPRWRGSTSGQRLRFRANRPLREGVSLLSHIAQPRNARHRAGEPFLVAQGSSARPEPPKAACGLFALALRRRPAVAPLPLRSRRPFIALAGTCGRRRRRRRCRRPRPPSRLVSRPASLQPCPRFASRVGTAVLRSLRERQLLRSLPRG